MSFFSWFMRKNSAKRRSPEPSGLVNADTSTPMPQRAPKAAVGASQPAPGSKSERMERRELLYIVVRDAMVCAGVLSASYKFKVLSLDPRGQQFLVMMDLAREFGGETARLSEIEALIAQTAKARYNIVVTAVYWRINDQVAQGLAQKGVAPHGASLPHLHPPQSKPQPVAAGTRAPVAGHPLDASPAMARHVPPVPPQSPRAPAPVRLVAPRFDPIEADEVAAFKQALASATATRMPVAAVPGVSVRSGPHRSAPSNSDFADTILPEQESRGQNLSNTQYGEL